MGRKPDRPPEQNRNVREQPHSQDLSSSLPVEREEESPVKSTGYEVEGQWILVNLKLLNSLNRTRTVE